MSTKQDKMISSRGTKTTAMRGNMNRASVGEGMMVRNLIKRTMIDTHDIIPTKSTNQHQLKTLKSSTRDNINTRMIEINNLLNNMKRSNMIIWGNHLVIGINTVGRIIVTRIRINQANTEKTIGMIPNIGMIQNTGMSHDIGMMIRAGTLLTKRVLSKVDNPHNWKNHLLLIKWWMSSNIDTWFWILS